MDQYLHHRWCSSKHLVHSLSIGWIFGTGMYLVVRHNPWSMAGGNHGIAQSGSIPSGTFNWLRRFLHALLWNYGGLTTNRRMVEGLHRWSHGFGFVWGCAYDPDPCSISRFSHVAKAVARRRIGAVDKINYLTRNTVVSIYLLINVNIIAVLKICDYSNKSVLLIAVKFL